MSDVKRILKHYGFKKQDTESNFQRLSHMRSSDLEKLILDLFDVLKQDDFKETGFFEFEAGRTLSGGTIPCSSYACRMIQLKKTLNFSVLYSDKISLKSPMDHYFNNLIERGFIDAGELLFDIESLIVMEPLIEKGIISFYSEYICLCQECYKKNKNKEDSIRKSILNNQLNIEELIKNKIQFALKYYVDHYYIRVFENMDFGFDHEMDIIIKDSTFLNHVFTKTELNNIKNGKVYSLNSQQHDYLFESCIVPVYVMPILNDIFYSKVFFEGTSKTYLSNRNIDGEIISILSSSVRQLQNISDSQILDKIEYAFPFIEESDYKKLISMRESELSSFKVFRDEFSKDIKKFDMTKDSYEDFQRDIIQPKINKINDSLERNKKYIQDQRWKNARNNIVFPLITFSVGKYFGLDTLSSLGFSGAVSISNQISKVFDKPSNYDVKSEDYYFLWNVQKRIKV